MHLIVHSHVFLLAFFLNLKLFSALSVGFKTNYIDESFLIIGDISDVASSVQITNVLLQLKIIKELYTKVKRQSVFTVKLGKNKRISRIHSAQNTFLYQVDVGDFINFLKERSEANIGTNYGMKTYLTIHNKASLLIKSSEIVHETIKLTLAYPNLLDIPDLFMESMDVSIGSRPGSPLVEYDAVYGGDDDDLTSGLLTRRTANKCPSCTIM